MHQNLARKGDFREWSLSIGAASALGGATVERLVLKAIHEMRKDGGAEITPSEIAALRDTLKTAASAGALDNTTSAVLTWKYHKYSQAGDTDYRQQYFRIAEQDKTTFAATVGIPVDPTAVSKVKVGVRSTQDVKYPIDPNEQARAATLNLRAARKAKASVAYASACVYLAAGMAVLDEAAWNTRHELMFGLWLERAQCEFLSGGLDMAEQLIATLFKHAVSKAERVAVYSQKVRLHAMKSENPQAVDNALACLRLFDIDLPQRPAWEQVQAEYEQVWHNLGTRPIEDIAALPLLHDAQVQASMDMLSDLIDQICP